MNKGRCEPKQTKKTPATLLYKVNFRTAKSLGVKAGEKKDVHHNAAAKHSTRKGGNGGEAREAVASWASLGAGDGSTPGILSPFRGGEEKSGKGKESYLIRHQVENEVTKGGVRLRYAQSRSAL